MKNNTSETEQKAENILSKSVFQCHSYLIHDLLEKNIFHHDDILNLYKSEQELLDEGFNMNEIKAGECDDVKEVYEWWAIDNWLTEEFEKMGEVLLKNEYGSWWGRQATGQMIIMDGTFQRLVESWNN